MLFKRIDTDILFSFKKKLENLNFNSKTINSISGKQLTRYVRISPREEFLLLTQVLHEDQTLLDLVKFFLLAYPIPKKSFVKYFNSRIFQHFLDLGIISVDGKDAYFSAFLTPLNGKYFLNDGDPEIKPERHVFAISQEQPYLIEACNILLQKNKDCDQILDICSGSGVIGQSLDVNNAKLYGVDINQRAVSYARFNALINKVDSNYSLLDITKNRPDLSFDVVVSNPPYNSIIDDIVSKEELDVTVHSGLFGDRVPNRILDISYNILNDNGVFAYIGAWLMKDGKLAHSQFEHLSTNGTLTLIHQPIVNIQSWEGLRRLYSLSPNFRKIPNGYLFKKIKEANYFNQVTWGILLYKKDGNPGFHKIYNVSTDAVLIPEYVRDRLSDIY
jgi:hypothetical protein